MCSMDCLLEQQFSFVPDHNQTETMLSVLKCIQRSCHPKTDAVIRCLLESQTYQKKGVLFTTIFSHYNLVFPLRDGVDLQFPAV